LVEIENKKMFEDIFNKFSISIRDRYDYSIEKCFRITIGTLETTEIITKAITMYGNGFLSYDTFFIDLDETLVENINGTGLNIKFYEGSIDIKNYLNQMNKNVYIITNNCRYTTDLICKKFNDSGCKISSNNIISPLDIIVSKFKNKKILFCGNDEQKKYLLTNGVDVFIPNHPTDDVHILDGIIFHDIYSFDYNFIFNFYKFSKDVPVYVSDNDKYFYANSIKFPDMGSIIEMFNIKYDILGKPNPDMISGVVYNKEH
jgi:ribonucleotide monophosphatase NagD (HAD superfamily)